MLNIENAPQSICNNLNALQSILKGVGRPLHLLRSGYIVYDFNPECVQHFWSIETSVL